MKGDLSARVALGGVFSGLCLLLMFLSSVLPATEYFMPMLAGTMLAAVVIENGAKAAMLVYAAASLLCVFIVPNLEAKLMFIGFFGYYPVLKHQIEKLRRRFLEILFKQIAFNAAVVASYCAGIYLLGLGAVFENDFLGKYAPFIFLAAGNGIFLLYDWAFTRYITLYIRWFKPKFLRGLRKN